MRPRNKLLWSSIPKCFTKGRKSIEHKRSVYMQKNPSFGHFKTSVRDVNFPTGVKAKIPFQI